jgi:O-antigen/teichoic acid export membrane protein
VSLPTTVDEPANQGRDRRDAGLYFAGMLVQRLGLFLALPMLLRALTVAQYGSFGLLQSAVNLLPPILALNVPATVTRLYFDGASSEDRAAIASQLSLLSGSLSLGIGLLAWVASTLDRMRTAALLGVPTQEVAVATLLVLVGAVGSNHLQVAWGIWRAKNQALHTAIASGLSSLLFVIAVGWLAHTSRLGIMSAIAAYAGATGIVGLAANLLATDLRPARFGPPSVTLTREALHYGLPLLPYLLALWGLGAGGRWIAHATLSLEDTGRFTLATQLATMIGLVGRSAYDAWSPRSFAMLADGRTQEARAYLDSRGRFTVVGVAALGVAATVAARWVLPRFAAGYASAATIFPLVALAPVFDVACLRYYTELAGLKATRPIATYTALTIGIFVPLGTAGAAFFGLPGLAAAYAGTYAVQLLLAARAVHNIRHRAGPGRSSDGVTP